jgi:prefoldin subunit 5
MTLDLSINLGNLLQIAAFIGGGFYFVMSMKSAISLMGQRLTSLERSNELQNSEIKKLGDVLVTLGRYEERFLRVEGMVDELRHGRGMIR